MKPRKFHPLVLIVTVTLGAWPAIAQSHHESHDQSHNQSTEASHTLPSIPKDLPRWMTNKDRNHLFPKRGVYNNDIYNVKLLALDLNAIAVGHAFAYEDLITGKANQLEIETFNRINWVLKNPPKFMPDEGNIAPTFNRKYGVLEQVFEWTHIFHAQTVDVLASTQLSDAEKEAEIERLYQFYINKVPYAITGLPMNMGYLDSQPYSKAFRQKYPKVNGLFWGYHWLQGIMYDSLYGKSPGEQNAVYVNVSRQYHEVELYRTDRPFMPMFAEVSPRFSQRFPEISNTFDNLHMLHDLVNDILASDWMTPQQQEEQVQRAIWMVMAANHEGMEPGKKYGSDGLHDHRFTEGWPGMGLMPEGLSHGNHGNSGSPETAPGQANVEDHSGHNHGSPNSAPKPPEQNSGQNSEDHSGHNHGSPNSAPKPSEQN